MRDGKGSTWEGGMREPAIAWWPGHVPAGVVTHELACTMDLFATCLKLAAAELPQDRVIDGLDIRPLLLGTGPSPRSVFFYYRGTQLYAVRKGPFKAHYITQPAFGPEKPVRHDPPLLFHLERDPSERFDVSADHPDVLSDIAGEVQRHRATVTPDKSQLEETVKSD